MDQIIIYPLVIWCMTVMFLLYNGGLFETGLSIWNIPLLNK